MILTVMTKEIYIQHLINFSVAQFYNLTLTHNRNITKCFIHVLEIKDFFFKLIFWIFILNNKFLKIASFKSLSRPIWKLRYFFFSDVVKNDELNIKLTTENLNKKISGYKISNFDKSRLILKLESRLKRKNMH